MVEISLPRFAPEVPRNMCSTDSRTDGGQLGTDPLTDTSLKPGDRDWKRRVVGAFDSASRAYEQHAKVQRRIAETLIRWASERVDPKLIDDGLEIGCGTGYLTREVLEKYADTTWTITDVSPSMLERCQSHPLAGPWIKPDTRFLVVDGEFPDFPDSTEENDASKPKCKPLYDLVVSNMTFQWFADLPAALPRIMRLVRPGGWVFFSMPGQDNFADLIEQYPCLQRRVNLSSNLERAGQVLQSMDNVTVERTSHVAHSRHANLSDFLHSLKMIGANQVRRRTPGELSELRTALKQSPADGHLLADYRTELFAAHKQAAT